VALTQESSFGDGAEIIIRILVLDGSSASPGTGRKRRRRSVALYSHDLKRWPLINTKKL